MARTVLEDYLQAFPFWLADVAPVQQGELPILNPLLGFASITAPEITAEVLDITEANWLFKRKVLKNADIGNLTLMRGATFYDFDFYNWMMAALGLRSVVGQAFGVGVVAGGTPRRNLLLIHYFTSHPVAGLADAAGQNYGISVSGLPASPGPFEVIAKVPARAFYLQGCLPVRYKSGSDFDAKSGDVSMMELELAVESMEQVVLTK